MPIYTPNHVVKVSCPDCGWHLIVNRGGFGDCLTGQNALRLALSLTPDACPRCGASNLQESPASFLQKHNPIEAIRRLHHVLFRQKGAS